jgi:hypothetical protein
MIGLVAVTLLWTGAASGSPPIQMGRLPPAPTDQGGGSSRWLIVTGLSGEPQYRAAFTKLGASLVDAGRDRWGLADSSLIYLAEDPSVDPRRITGRATKEAVLGAVASLASWSRPNDVVVVVLIGHGSQQADLPQLNLPGPDLSAGDLAQALSAFQDQTVVVINTASASGGFIPILSGPRRIVITATKSGFERNATMFGELFVKGLVSAEADADKNGRVSVAEAYSYARREVARAYEVSKRLLTEHSQLDDNGDGKGVLDLGNEGDGGLAKTVAFGLAREVGADDPAVAPLLATRRDLENAISALRARKATTDSAGYQRQLEELLLKLAETNQAIRAAQGKKP